MATEDLKFPWRGVGMITVQQFAEYLQCTPKVVYGMIDRDKIQTLYVGRERRIPRAEAFRFLRRPDPEGSDEPGPTIPRRPRLAAEQEAVVRRFLER